MSGVSKPASPNVPNKSQVPSPKSQVPTTSPKSQIPRQDFSVSYLVATVARSLVGSSDACRVYSWYFVSRFVPVLFHPDFAFSSLVIVFFSFFVFCDLFWLLALSVWLAFCLTSFLRFLRVACLLLYDTLHNCRTAFVPLLSLDIPNRTLNMLARVQLSQVNYVFEQYVADD